MFLVETYNTPERIVDDNPGYTIKIPRAHARLETSIIPKMEELDEVECYELFVRRQVGSVYARRDSYVFTRLPKSGQMIAIVLYKDGGVDFQRLGNYHTLILRELDEKDRHILRGFCHKYHFSLINDIRSNDQLNKDRLRIHARSFSLKDIPKRIKWGPSEEDKTEYYKKYNLLSYTDESVVTEEIVSSVTTEKTSSIFDNIVFI